MTSESPLLKLVKEGPKTTFAAATASYAAEVDASQSSKHLPQSHSFLVENSPAFLSSLPQTTEQRNVTVNSSSSKHFR